MSRNQVLIYLVGSIVVALLGAVVQQLRFPDSSAWIVVLLAAGYLLLIFAVTRLRDRQGR